MMYGLSSMLPSILTFVCKCHIGNTSHKDLGHDFGSSKQFTTLYALISRVTVNPCMYLYSTNNIYEEILNYSYLDKKMLWSSLPWWHLSHVPARRSARSNTQSSAGSPHHIPSPRATPTLTLQTQCFPHCPAEPFKDRVFTICVTRLARFQNSNPWHPQHHAFWCFTQLHCRD